MKRDSWQCLQMAINVDDTNGSVEVSMDGEPALSLTGLDTLGPDPYMMLVVTNGNGFDSGNYYVDDLVMATSPVGCED